MDQARSIKINIWSARENQRQTKHTHTHAESLKNEWLNVVRRAFVCAKRKIKIAIGDPSGKRNGRKQSDDEKNHTNENNTADCWLSINGKEQIKCSIEYAGIFFAWFLVSLFVAVCVFCAVSRVLFYFSLVAIAFYANLN